MACMAAANSFLKAARAMRFPVGISGRGTAREGFITNQIQISEKEADLNSITLKLREIDSVTAVFNIDLDTIKDKNLHYLTQ